LAQTCVSCRYAATYRNSSSHLIFTRVSNLLVGQDGDDKRDFWEGVEFAQAEHLK